MGLSENSVPHCTQWFSWSLSLWKMAISLGILTQHFQTYPYISIILQSQAHCSWYLRWVPWAAASSALAGLPCAAPAEPCPGRGWRRRSSPCPNLRRKSRPPNQNRWRHGRWPRKMWKMVGFRGISWDFTMKDKDFIWLMQIWWYKSYQLMGNSHLPLERTGTMKIAWEFQWKKRLAAATTTTTTTWTCSTMGQLLSHRICGHPEAGYYTHRDWPNQRLRS